MDKSANELTIELIDILEKLSELGPRYTMDLGFIYLDLEFKVQSSIYYNMTEEEQYKL